MLVARPPVGDRGGAFGSSRAKQGRHSLGLRLATRNGSHGTYQPKKVPASHTLCVLCAGRHVHDHGSHIAHQAGQNIEGTWEVISGSLADKCAAGNLAWLFSRTRPAPSQAAMASGSVQSNGDRHLQRAMLWVIYAFCSSLACQKSAVCACKWTERLNGRRRSADQCGQIGGNYFGVPVHGNSPKTNHPRLSVSDANRARHPSAENALTTSLHWLAWSRAAIFEIRC
ncbi:hypothetical protein DL89DRAFT_13464 [Linderina pennispora]|uniref:Uncharacterized protein n=1 Tax=Linderina pennispora TaxID=61395 RepID=A0A1Y1WL43_9FUNG|nr:uncharacterized protein DL89DRAFT_13464 [Linderina pennispora]ORX74289.1 hypothetical protein DL89DRAFT_13464 [Linderina pennispora]